MSFANNRVATNLKRKHESNKSCYAVHKEKRKAGEYYQRRLFNRFSFWNNKDIKHHNITLSSSHSNNIGSSSSSGNEYEDGDVEDNDIINDYEADFDQIKTKNSIHLDVQDEYFPNISDQKDKALTIESYIFNVNNNQPDTSLINDESEVNLSYQSTNSKALKSNKSFKDLLLKVTPFRNNSNTVDDDVDETDIKTVKEIGQIDFNQDMKAKEKVLTYIDEAIDDVWGRIYDSSTFAEEEIMTLYEHNVPSYITFEHGHLNQGYRRHHSSFSSTTSTNSNHSFHNVGTKTDIKSAFTEELKRRSTIGSINQGRSSVSHDTFAQKWKSLEIKLKDIKSQMEALMASRDIEHIKLFWSLWDSIKDQCVQLLEIDEDEDSENISETQLHSVIENLEKSRVFYI
ncbi:uncharacterized protein HGUI_01792 [Hanseniaspora guilliermondii]|uniref:Uncharacterized protein n=1 Tax=Hanseniaspora guilliermondii TaxID=56406 RepID=A0A1L0AZP9_9ASCO|nr:uncharacterized protein HGUI_01792 [Hanseniaspora guilliermondii]